MSGAVCDICTRESAVNICLCVYPCVRLGPGCIGRHCSQANTSHSLEPISALNLIKSRGDLPAFFTRQQFLNGVSEAMAANLTAVRKFREDVESMFTQVDLCRTSKMAEIAEAERALEASVNLCQGQLDAQRYAPVAQPRNRLEYIVAQAANLNLADVRKELTFFAASSYEIGHITRMLDSIRISVVPGVNARAANQAAKAPVLSSATAGPVDSQMEDLQRRLTELTMETTAKDQALATMKNNRDELKSQYAAKRAEYEATIKELRSRASGAVGAPSHLQDTIQDLKDQRKHLQETVKQYEDALNTLKSQFSQKLSQLQEAKEKVEKDAVAMALLLRDKLPTMEKVLKERTMERDSLTDLRNKLEGLLSSVPMINVGCNEGKMVLQARRLIDAQKNGGSEDLPSVIRIVMMGI